VPQDGVATRSWSEILCAQAAEESGSATDLADARDTNEKTDHRYGQRFGGASDLLGLVQIAGEPETLRRR
jgi:hypothetical protein